MSKNFRTGLFGFNKEDVLNFVAEAKALEANNKKSITALNNDITEMQNKIKELSDELSNANDIIAEFNQREAALTALSEAIGRLYLVAQANADAVAAAAKENAALSEKAVSENITVADSAEAEIEEISMILEQKTAQYLAEVNELKKTIAATKLKIAENNAVISQSQTELDSISSGVK